MLLAGQMLLSFSNGIDYIIYYLMEYNFHNLCATYKLKQSSAWKSQQHNTINIHKCPLYNDVYDLHWHH